MHGKRWSGFALMAAVTISALLIGCAERRGGRPPVRSESQLAGTLKDIGGAPAALSVAEPMRPFFAAGLGFIILGGLAVCAGGRATGLALLGLGLATTATGVLFVQYPWSVLALAAVAVIAAGAAAYDQWRARRRLAAAAGELARNREALEAAAEVIQNAPEGKAIKTGLSALGAEVERTVRAVIDPIKDKLRREGRIE